MDNIRVCSNEPTQNHVRALREAKEELPLLVLDAERMLKEWKERRTLMGFHIGS